MFLFCMNRCGLGGCTGHSSRKKAHVADAFKGLLVSPFPLVLALSILQQASQPEGLHWASRRLKHWGINAPGSSPQPWWIEVGE